MQAFLSKFNKVKKLNSSADQDLKKQILAGVTSFFAISYIIIVNPMILKDAGIPFNLSIFATIMISVVGCLIMALWRNATIILTPGKSGRASCSERVEIGGVAGMLKKKRTRTVY